MSVSLKQSQAIRQIARVVYDFLPGSGSRQWKGHVTFESVARGLGIADYWAAGSKEPAIAQLLENTLERRTELFERLTVTVVREGITYRQRQGKPIAREEIEALNGLILEVGFKFPELWDKGFLDSLSGDSLAKARETARSVEKVGTTSEAARASILSALRLSFYDLAALEDRQAAGLAFERLLNDLFRLFDLVPREPFRVTGEQIDGSFVMDFETYLLEAKWTKSPVIEADLLIFRGKVEGKSAFTRGLFVSLNGATDPALEAITRGKQANFFLLDGYDLTAVFEGQAELPALLRWKFRVLAEEGKVFVSAREMPIDGERIHR
jgi:hypothetical protein